MRFKGIVSMQLPKNILVAYRTVLCKVYKSKPSQIARVYFYIKLILVYFIKWLTVVSRHQALDKHEQR
ncbi:hypothetical protein BXU10_14100 [Flavobacterium sp. LM4]|nr:hypothetical protein BXU10_14100 [Flavobacterium sp. LM4]